MSIGRVRYCVWIFVVQLTITLMVTSFVRCSSSIGGRYMLVQEEDPPIVMPDGEASSGSFNKLLLDTAPSVQQFKQHQLQSPVTVALNHPIGQCKIEFQVTKVMPGWCTQLGRGSGRACVSGNHLIPFHPDCM